MSKIIEKRTPHQIARRIIVSGRPCRGTYGSRGFRLGKLKIMLAVCDTLYMVAKRRGQDIYFYVFPNDGQGRSARDILRRALPY